MGLNATGKILAQHLVEGTLTPGGEIGLRVDRALMQDATGTLACLEYEALGLSSPKIEHAIVYVDHNVLQTGYENPDDHRFLQTFASKNGIYYSKPGNGICHQVNLERFSVPGKILLGSDSHTPTAGGAGMLGFGVGGLDVAVAMGGLAFYVKMPKIVGVHLTGRLQPWVSAKDVILELLRRYTVKGGLGRIFEYYGPGTETLSVPERATITNMGAELGATSSIFPSDRVTLDYFKRQSRAEDWRPMMADTDAEYDETVEVQLDELEPLMATPGSPDNIQPVEKLAGTSVDQVLIGSCTNSSYHDLMVVSHTLQGRHVHPRVSFAVNPGSRQVVQTILDRHGLDNIISAGARVLENACQGCIGMGSAPGSGWVSVRSYNRNFPGRSGTPNDHVYLASPETCVACAVEGEITDPRKLGEYPKINWPVRFNVDDSMVITPSKDPSRIEVERGPNIKPLPIMNELESKLEGEVLVKLGDDVSTDTILPGGAEVLPLRSNIPQISKYTFRYKDPDFAKRSQALNGGFILAGANYGQGSSREHAALACRYLGVKAVIAKSYARIHRSNLINFGIPPFVLKNEQDYDLLESGKRVRIPGTRTQLKQSFVEADVLDLQSNAKRLVKLKHELTEREISVLLSGGLLNYARASNQSLDSRKVG